MKIFYSISFLCLLLFCKTTFAAIKVAAIFTDNMVLQQGIPVKVWGMALPGEKIQVLFAGKQVTVTAAADGRWLISLPSFNYGGPYEMQVKGTADNIRFKNIMVGEVWLASGQSNMNFQLKRPINNVDSVAALANFPMIREYNVPLQLNSRPMYEMKAGQWMVCDPKTVLEFSAVAYFFAKALHLEKKIAVGIIHSSWGGTRIESWMSAQALEKHPDYKDKIAAVVNDITNWAAMQVAGERVDSVRSQIMQTSQNGTALGVQKVDYIDSAWKFVNYPIKMGDIKAPSYAILWFRKTIDVPAGNSQQDFTLNLGKLLESDITYFNGVEIGRSKQLDQTIYTVPASLLRPGKNTIAIRLTNAWGSGQIGSPVDIPYLQSKNGGEKISLTGKWLYNLDIEPSLVSGTSYSNKPTALFNAMIAPLVPYGIKGILWYQGESNAGGFDAYKTLQPLLINDWRKQWGLGSIPFLFVQLPNLKGASAWPRMREAQSASLAVSNTGMAVTIDVGDKYDVHPHNKAPVGERLALLADHVAYKEKLVYSGPVLNKYFIKDGAMQLLFDTYGSKIIIRDTVNGTGFFIAGEDHVFYPANIVVTGNEIKVSASVVKKPVAVRYAWDADPKVTLFNKEGLPAAPFRTDTWKD